jgi:hypothetical protein
LRATPREQRFRDRISLGAGRPLAGRRVACGLRTIAIAAAIATVGRIAQDSRVSIDAHLFANTEGAPAFERLVPPPAHRVG